MIPQFKQDFLHVEGSRQSLDQNSGPDGIMRHFDVRLREEEDVVPKTRFEVMLHFGEIEVRAGPALDELVGIVIEVKPKIEEGARDRRTVDGEPGLIQVPASGSRRSR
jgi:hypothetical protein